MQKLALSPLLAGYLAMTMQAETPVAETPKVETPETPKEGEKPAEAKKTRQMTFTVGEDGKIRADFGEGLDPLYLSPSDIPETIQADALAEGLISRARGYTSKLVDKDRTPEALRLAVNKGFENLLKGIWKIERAPGEGTPDYSIEVEAAYLFRQMRVKAQNKPIEEAGTIEAAAESFAKLTDEEKKKLKALPRYQLAMAEVKSKRAAAKLEAMAKKLEEDKDGDGF